MSKNWEVELHYVVTVAVEDAENEEKALEYAENELSFISDLDMTDGRFRVVSDPTEWKTVVRHADKVASK